MGLFSFDPIGDIKAIIFLLLFFVILTVVVCTGLGIISFGDMADGQATDSVARVSYGGVLWKTWRVELTNDHPIGTQSGTVQQRYGVENNETLIALLQNYSASGEKVNLHYKSHLFVFGWEFSDPEVIVSVDKIDGTG